MLVSIHKLKTALLLIAALFAAQSLQAQVLTLQQCIDSARDNNKTLQIAINKIKIGEQKQEEVRANLKPKLNLNAEYKYFTNLPYQLMPQSVFGGTEGTYKEAQFGVPHNINANLQFAMPLYNPQVRGAIKTTEIATELAELQYQKTEEQLFFEIANLYYNAQILASQMSFIDSNLVNSKRLLKTMQLLKEQLLAKGTDVSKVQLQVDQLNTQREIVNSQYDKILNALKFTMGIPIERKIKIDANIEYNISAEYTPISTIDFRMAEAQNRLFSSEINTLEKSRLPTVSLFASYGTTGYGYDGQPDAFLNFYAIGFAGVRMTYPLFDGKTSKIKINQKNIELRNSALQLDLLNDKTNMEALNARQQKSVAQKSVMTTQKQVGLAEAIYNQTDFQRKNGVATLTDLLLADNALREAQQNYLSAIIEYLKADLELKKVTGNLTVQH